MTLTTHSREYRNRVVQAVKALPRDKYGRISHDDFCRLNEQVKADRRSGIITDLDAFNMSCVLGEAVNLPRDFAA